METNLGYDKTSDNVDIKKTHTDPKGWKDVDLLFEEQRKQKKKEAEEDDDNLQCGWFSWRPRLIQFFNGPKGFLLFVCMLVLTQGMTINGFVFVSITTLERRFDLPSLKSGWIASTYDFSVMCVIVFVTYFGETAHKPKCIAAGAFIYSLGSLTFALPHFLTGLYNADGTEFDTCDPGRNETSNCSDDEEDLSRYYGFFIAGQVLHGIGTSPLYTLGYTYIDENVSPHLTSMFIGVFQATATLGPAIGFLVGGMLLDIYTDFTEVDSGSLPIEPDSPLWVGAWWMGFLISCGLAMLVITPLSGFTKRLPGALEAQRERIKEVRTGSEFEPRAGLGVNSLLDFPRAVWTLFKNPTYMFLDLATVCEWFILAFISVFGPKYFESMFNMTSGNAALVAGLIVTPAGLTGHMVGGWIVKRFKLKVRGMLRFIICSLTISLCLMTSFLLTCDNVDFAGVTVQYDNTTLKYPDSESNLISSCNTNCQCDDTFDPVCGSNNIMYYSSCYAGCTVENKTLNGVTEFEQCWCISEANSIFTPSEEVGTAVLGRCKDPCASFVPYMIILFFLLMFGFCTGVPSTTITLRCVDYDQRSFAMGFQSLLARALGSIPGPIAVGALIDKTCLVWETGCSGSKTCWMYNNRQLSLYMLAMSVGLRFGSIAFFSGALLTYKTAATDDDKDMIREESTQM